MMKAEDIKLFLSISDLQLSAKFITLIHDQVELEIKIDALTQLVQASGKLDSHALAVAEQYSRTKPEFIQKEKVLLECGKAIKAACENPQARLQAMIKAKMEGRG